MMGNEAGIPTLVAVVVSSIIAAFIILAAIRRSRAKEPKKAPKTVTLSWTWIFLIAVSAMIGYAFSGKQPGRVAEPDPLSGWVIVLIVPVLIFGWLAFLVGRAYYQIYDRSASRALKRARSGDTAGAIAELRAAIDASRGPAPAPPDGADNPYASPRPRDKRAAIRANMMGSLHSLRDEWGDAYDWFRRAEAEGFDQGFTIGNQGLALSKLGRLDEALPLLEKACSLRPEQVAIPSNLGHVLADLGRVDEARQQLSIAEANLKKILWASRSDRKAIDEELDRLREKLQIVKE